MEYSLRQTPSFGLSSPIPQKEIPRATHRENVTSEKKDPSVLTSTKPARSSGHSHHRYHFHSPFHRHHDHGVSEEQHQTIPSLPFIPPEEVVKANGEDNNPLWIVIDDIVYDVTEFATRHPGGKMPLKNLGGQSCSWQFHRVHGKHTLERYGPELRIGQSRNVPNAFKEPKPSLVRQLWGSHFF